MRLPGRVTMVEVGARDGLQNEPVVVPAAVKARLIELLAAAGLTVIEAGAFVSPRAVPQMADTAAVLALLPPMPGRRRPVLVPNLTGYRHAVAAGAGEVAVLSAASEEFCQANLGCSQERSLERAGDIAVAARRDGIAVRGYVSCALGCPYRGAVAPEAVVRVARRLADLGAAEISLGDTTGIGTPGRAQAMVDAVAAAIPVERLAAHFHDTRGQALANVLAVLECGVAVIDSSVAGLGGCPFAPGAAGNVASEDVLYMLDGLAVETGVDLPSLVRAGWFICDALGRTPRSKVSQALAGEGRQAQLRLSEE